jgi:hypothetical protein
MNYDKSVPTLLKQTQQWFASIITRPIDENSKMNPMSPSGKPMLLEAGDYIVPNSTQNPAERIEIYNQQYWWRLLGVMQENFPTVTRLFGFYDFNELIAVPYLVKYPPHHWSLNNLGDHLVKWIEEDYHANDKVLVKNAALIDWAYIASFVSAKDEGINIETLPTPGDFSIYLDCPLKLQPSVYLFELPYDLFKFRFEFSKQDPDYWLEHDFPILTHQPENLHFLLFRNRYNNIVVDTISHSEFQLLKKFEAGTSIDNICQWLEELPDESKLVKEASENLHVWIQRWIANSIFKKI